MEQSRAAKNRARFGSQKEILTRARAEERLERDLAKVAWAVAPDPRRHVLVR